jgi:hypothetical protein
MAKKLNPVKALDAIISNDIVVKLDNNNEITVKPISISTLAILDSIDSPLLHSDKEMTMLNILPTVYVCINGYKAAFTDKSLIELALEWFDNQQFTTNDFDNNRNAILVQFNKVLNIQPEISEDKKK